MFRFKTHTDLSALLVEGRHVQLRELGYRYLQRIPLRDGKSLSKHYRDVVFTLAKSEYFQGFYGQSAARLEGLLSLSPDHADIYYWLADIARLQHNRPLAWQHLEKIAAISKRLKTWLYMAQLVRHQDDLDRFMDNLQRARRMNLVPDFHPHLQQYIAVANQYAGDYPRAFNAWQRLLARTPLKRKPLPFSRVKARVTWRTSSALKALHDLKNTLEGGDVDMFLISGTLLGAIREGRILPHDNDVDVGIWAHEDVQRIHSLISSSGYFHILPQREGDALRVKHLNGMAIDVFRHHQEGDQVWHGGVKVRWYNSAFSINSLVRLGSTYSVPEEYEQYLRENYGNWRKQIPHFDSTLDTPNARIMSYDELVLHCFKQYYKQDFGTIRHSSSRYLPTIRSI